jgi:hypothetical protein
MDSERERKVFVVISYVFLDDIIEGVFPTRKAARKYEEDRDLMCSEIVETTYFGGNG